MRMEELPPSLLVEILSRLTDSTDLVRCRVVSKSLNAVSYDVRCVSLVCSMSRYLKSRSPETKHLVTPFKTVFKNLVRSSNNLESVSLGVDRALGGISFDDVEDESDDLYLTDFNFIKDWLPSVSHALKSFSVSDFWVQSCWRRSEALSLISSTCRNLVKLVVRNAWLSVDGLCSMPTLAILTLEFVRLDDEDLSRINSCFPNLTQLNLIGVGGLKDPKINLSHLTTCQWSVSNAPLSLIICAPCLVDLNLKCIRPRLIVLDAPSLSNFDLSLENADELRFKNCANMQCLQLNVECLSIGFLRSMSHHCSMVKRLTLDLDGKTERGDVIEFGFDTLLEYFPSIIYLNLGYGAWRVMENSFRWGGLEDRIGMKSLKELVAHLVVNEMGYTLAFIFSVLDKCAKLSDVSLLVHRDVDSYVASNLISACRSKFPRVRWRWGIWKEGIKDTWVCNGI
ncbi:F-box/LRR-repeat protein At4g29420 [Abrus precatorius]|uniref:F-box/LRR-repeat protein At4g29420 n=1 Tax=Abrus precatorius TaxID=3816 RepID=A0A8B8KGT8_ABRPR|nr:F-box/LRR-repeat protein At4g29420 [Abrus precatorius]